MRRPDPDRRPMSVEEYLRLEAAATTKHEYVEGEVYAMSGVTRRHARIVSNFVIRLGALARGGPCEVIAVDVKVRVGDRFYYPDVMVVCTPGDDEDVVVRDPCLLIEVTSPSTARIDRSEKLDAYRTLPSLQAYLVVDHRRRRVERHWRDADGDWRREDVAGEEDVPVPCPETALTLDAIYDGVELALAEEESAYDVEAIAD